MVNVIIDYLLASGSSGLRIIAVSDRIREANRFTPSSLREGWCSTCGVIVYSRGPRDLD